MPTYKPTTLLSAPQKQLLLQQLEAHGQSQMQVEWQHMLQRLLPSDSHNGEFLARYLLLTAVLDQQADSISARETVTNLYHTYGSTFFLSPQNYLNQMHNLIRFTKSFYKPKTPVLGIRNEGITLLRIGGYLLSLLNISQAYSSLLNFLSQSSSPIQLLRHILADDLLGGLLYDRAARLYTGWISHPTLVNLSKGKWHVSTIPMVVNGHVCKVFSRSGFLNSVSVENFESMIIEPEYMRDQIDNQVKSVYQVGDHFMIDYGAFHIGINFCGEASPSCDNCPIQNICLKNTRFRAYTEIGDKEA